MSYPQDRKRLDNRETSAEALVSFFLDRVEERNGQLNAFLSVDAEAALGQARAVDARRERGEMRPLDGLVVGVKDTIAVRDRPMTCGSKLLARFRAEFDATVVERLRSNGAVILGKTNCDEFGMGSSNEYSAFGIVRNPIDDRLTPGGSSGGSAAAVRAGLCHAALGSDTGGSVRLPAAFCGVSGFRPTWSRVSRHGLAAFASSMDTIGWMADDPSTLTAMRAAVEGPDGRDAVCTDAVDAGVAPGASMVRLEWEGRPEIEPSVRVALDRLDVEGTVSADALRFAVGTYHVLSSVEAMSNLARYDGVRYGRRGSSERPDDPFGDRAARSEGLGPEVRWRILLGTYLSSRSDSAARLDRARRMRRRIADELSEALIDASTGAYRFLVTPTSGASPFRLGAFRDRPTDMYAVDAFTIPAALAGLPAVTIPVPVAGSDWPPGIQITGAAGSDALLLAVAGRLCDQLK